MRSLFELDPPPTADRRRLPPEVRRTILELKAEYPAFSLREIARICRERFDRPVSHHAVERVLLGEALPLPPPRRFRRYHEIADPVAPASGGDAVFGWLERQGNHRLSRNVAADGLRRAATLGRGGLAGAGGSLPRPAPARPQGRSQGHGRHPPAAGQPRARGVPDPRGVAPTGAAPLATHLRPHPCPAP